MKSANTWREARVMLTQDIARDVRHVVFDVPGEALAFDPGSHIRILTDINGMPVERSYSCVPCAAGKVAISVKLHPNSRGGSRHVWSLSPGDAVRLTLPENRFALSWTAQAYTLLAGGIGITPIYGMAQALVARGKDVTLHFGAEDAQAMAYRDELGALLGDRVRFYSRAEGQMPDLDAIIAELAPEGELYMCGPLPMLSAAKAAWARAGRPVSRLRYEVFGDSGAFAEQPFEVEILGLGKTVEVSSTQTLLGALLTAGIDMIHDCQRGECGLCAVDLIEVTGGVDHRDVFFSDAEKASNRHMCSCVSRLTGGRAVIDIGYRA
jgi:ferredoxin-NADP reductase